MTSPVSAIIGFPLQGAPNRRDTVAFSQTSPDIGRGRISLEDEGAAAEIRKNFGGRHIRPHWGDRRQRPPRR
ncbi:hypothetical protein [Nocardia gipuzkoensis]|uniref:hypothetical protein n=1 Tax=Nocardia gipuzkoensis TaxID=2749991 RepID=UPI0015EE6033|nr:hypothetical protein [Nocardia gipuzkoensis]